MKRIGVMMASIAITALVGGPANATCSAFHCSDSIRGLMVDETTANAHINVNLGDESSLNCVPTAGPAPFVSSLQLKRTSPIFTEAYQVLLLASAATLPVRIELRPTVGAACDVVRVTFDPFSSYP